VGSSVALQPSCCSPLACQTNLKTKPPAGICSIDGLAMVDPHAGNCAVTDYY
jgi:hypothetical protein